MTERTTPETDEASFSTAYQGELVAASFARRLERQRDELLEALRQFVELDLSKTSDSLVRYIVLAHQTNAEVAFLAAVKGGDQ